MFADHVDLAGGAAFEADREMTQGDVVRLEDLLEKCSRAVY